MGIELDELIDVLSHNHEAEFTWKNMTFMIQPEDDHLVMYRFSPDLCYLCKIPCDEPDLVGKNAVLQVLNEKCLDGRSFIELQHEIFVDVIY
jgi:hypothetical protein